MTRGDAPAAAGPDDAALRFVASEEEAGERIDVVLAAIARVSRSQAKRWVEAGRVWVGDAPVARASLVLAIGDRVAAAPPEPVRAEALPEPIPLDVVFEDEHLIVVDKPAGLVVHPAPGHARGTLVNALLHHARELAGIGGVLRPGIVHRLDQGTSGILVAAKTDAAHQALAVQFHDHTIERRYQAIVRATPSADEGRVDAPIGRHPRDRKRMSVAAKSGREAHTRWCVAARFARSERALLDVRPETGRTHQIRVHLSSVGMPLVGDPVYGGGRGTGREKQLGRPALHAAELGFAHPATSVRMRFTAPLPADLEALLAHYREREGLA
ncbi:MAG: RluA family pseudouridine synthase [Myxococcota bacterium]